MSNEVPEGYKMTEIGVIPEEWKAIDTTDILFYQEGPGIRSYEYTDTGCHIINVRCVRDGYINLDDARYVSWDLINDKWKHFLIEQGDILVTTSGTIGRVARVRKYDLPLLMNTSVVRFRSLDNDILSDDYLQFFLMSRIFYDQLYAQHTGAVIKNVGPAHIVRTRVMIPPLHEQQAIASILSSIQEAKEKTDAVIQSARELKKSLMKHLFTYGPVPLDEAENVPLKETEIGMIPEEWDVVKLGDTGDIITGTTPRTDVKEYYGDEYMFISPGDMGKTKYVYDTSKWLSEDGLNVSRVLPRNTVLVVCIGATIGKISMTYNAKSTTNQQINAIIANDNVCPHYLYYAIDYRSGKLPSLAGRAAVPIVNKSSFSKFTISMPPLHIQQNIAGILSAVDHKIEAEENKSKALGELFRTMLHNLMTGKIRVRNMEI